MTKRSLLLTLLLSLFLLTFLSGTGVYAQVGADRVAVTGVVSDPSGAAVPDASITLLNQDTGVKTVVATDGAGNFTTPGMILGKYTLQVSKEGFKAVSQPDLDLSIGGRTYTQNVTLQLGAVSQTIEVNASAQLINTQSSAISYQVGKEYYQDLPDVMGADVRLAETKLILSPGYVPTAPNGDAIFRGDAFESRINGGQTVSWESWFDGAEYGYAEGHQQTHESSIPYSAVQELTTTVNNFSAQYGHTSGGIALYTTKSGTSDFHGTVYDILTSQKLDAANFFFNSSTPPLQKLPLTQNNPGIAVGGPIPKFHLWGKTFFFTNYDRLDYHSTVNIGYENTLPTPAERGGDFSQLLQSPNAGCSSPPCQIATDAMGRPIYYGEIFNPATTQTVMNAQGKQVPVRTGYGFDPVTGLPTATANMIPGVDPLMKNNPGAQYVASIIPNPDRNTLFTPNEFGGTSDDNDKINVWTWLFRVDHTFNDKWSATLTYFQNHRPRTAHCGGPDGCNTVNNGQTDSKANDTYLGQGFYQLITNHFAHLQINTVIKPNLFNHATLSYDRWVMDGHQLASGVGWNAKLGLGLPNDPAFNNAGFPQLNFNNGPVGYTHYGTPWLGNGADINNRYQFYDDLTWIVGKHTVKMGLQSNYITFPQTGWAINTGGNFNFNAQSTAGYDNNGNNLANANSQGDAFASFLLGQVDSANFSVFEPYMPKIHYVAPWVNDSFKVTPHLTLDYGLRLDHNSGVSEQHNRFSTFVPTATQTIDGATVAGATVFNSSIADGNGSTGVAPRFGFAYSLGQNSVIRGGYGLYYGATIADSWDAYPVDGYQANPTVANTTNDYSPSFYFGNATGAAVQNVASGFPSKNITFPPNLTPGVADGGSPVAVSPNNYEMPIWQNWNISFQHQWGSNISLDVAYVGNHGTRLPDDRASAGLLFNMNNPSVLQYGSDLQNSGFNNGVAYGNVHGVAAPWPNFSGNLAHALLPFPEYNPEGIQWRKTHNGASRYNALQMQFIMRGHNTSTTIAYTLSRLLNNGAESGQEGGLPVQNPINMSNLWGPSGDDVPQVLTVGEVYTLPFGKGRKLLGNSTGLLDKLVSHWSLSGIASYQSGRPLTMYAANTLGGNLFNPNEFPNILSGQPIRSSGSFTDPNSQTYFATTPKATNCNTDPNPQCTKAVGFSIPDLFTFGNSPRTRSNTRGFPYYNEDVSLYKDTYFGESKYVRIEAEAGNIFNRVDFCTPDTNISDASVGVTSTQCNIPRRIQIGLEIFF